MSLLHHWRRRERGMIRAYILLFAGVWIAVDGAKALDPHKQITQYVHETWTSKSGLPENDIEGIAQTADGFADELKRLKIDFYEMKPGETISFRGKQLVKARK